MLVFQPAKTRFVFALSGFRPRNQPVELVSDLLHFDTTLLNGVSKTINLIDKMRQRLFVFIC